MNSGIRDSLRFFLGKLLQMIVVLLILSFLVFVIARLCPGEPLRAYYGDGIEHMSQAQKEAAREKLGLDASLPAQYVHWFSGLLHGDLGLSFKYKQPVGEVIGDMWQNTLILGLTAYVLTFIFAVLLGSFCALRENSTADRIICRVGTVSSNIPVFFVSLLLIMLFSVKLGWLPAGGAYSYGNSGSLPDRLLHLVLPVLALMLEHLWYYAYLVRNMLAEETRRDYVLLCKAEGMSRGRILRRHCLRNVLPSLFVIMAFSLPHILGGTYIVEMVFAYPGLGTLSFESAMYQDYNMLMALTMLTGAVILLFNLGAQLLSEYVDPRTGYARQRREAV